MHIKTGENNTVDPRGRVWNVRSVVRIGPVVPLVGGKSPIVCKQTWDWKGSGLKMTSFTS
ncbi:hypothetical protein ACVMAJ_004410 [Bradyrhizobium sp. USDA 4448]